MNDVAITDANREYFVSLAHSRGSIGSAYRIACVIAFVLLLCTVGPLWATAALTDHGGLTLLVQSNVALLGFCLLLSSLSVFKKVAYRHQILSSSLLAFASVLMAYALCLLGVLTASTVTSLGVVSLSIFAVAGWGAVVLLVGATLVHVLLLRRRLRVGHSVKRMRWNVKTISTSNRSIVFGLGLGLAPAVASMATQGEYVPNIFGAAMLIFFGVVLPSLPVELVYLTVLKSRDRTYWEVAKSLPARTRQIVRKRIVKGAAIAGCIVLALAAAICGSKIIEIASGR